jgi:hypothetical protein
MWYLPPDLNRPFTEEESHGLGLHRPRLDKCRSLYCSLATRLHTHGAGLMRDYPGIALYPGGLALLIVAGALAWAHFGGIT